MDCTKMCPFVTFWDNYTSQACKKLARFSVSNIIGFDPKRYYQADHVASNTVSVSICKPLISS